MDDNSEKENDKPEKEYASSDIHDLKLSDNEMNDQPEQESASSGVNKFNLRNSDLSSQQGQILLHERMKKLASTKTSDDKTKEQYLCFRLGEEEQYGVPYKYLKEILSAERFVKVPGVVDHIVGVINWRSKILAVLDLRKIFNINHQVAERLPWIIVVTSNNITMGIVADDIIGDESFVLAELAEPLPLTNTQNNQYVSGIDKGCITVLNIDAVLSQYTNELQESDADQLGEFDG
jgi:purine-binding chemotaxis protein CheW